MGVATYCVMATIAGPSGIVATRKAFDAAKRMNGNIATLSSLNEAYSAEWDALSNVAESTALEARSLGYLAGDEVVIRLSVPAGSPEPASPGERLVYEPEPTIDESTMKKIAVAVALAVFALGTIMRFFPANGAPRHHRDILVQEASRT